MPALTSTRQVAHLPFTGATTSAALCPWILESDWAETVVVYCHNGQVWARQSDTAYPVWNTDHPVTDGPADAAPRVALHPSHRIYLVFQRTRGGTTSVYYAWSDDDGQSFGSPLLALSGATRPTIAIGPDGSMLIAAFNPADGRVRAIYADPDGVFGSEFNLQLWNGSALTNLLLSDDSFHFMQGFDAAGRWWMACHEQGLSTISILWSADEGQSWFKVM